MQPSCLPRGGRPALRAIAALCASGALLIAACGSATSGTGSPSADHVAVSRQYLAIAVAGNRHLERDFDGLGADHSDVRRARAYLRDAAATERLFDRRVRRLPLPAGAESVARVLVAANEARAQLADRAAASASLAQLQVYEPALTAANALVENAVRVLRGTLGLPPPKTS